MIDIGVNLTSSQFADEQADLVARARAAGVEALILTGTDLVGSHESATLAARWPGYCFSTAGVHPTTPRVSMRRPCPPCASWRRCHKWWLSASAGSTTIATSRPVRCRMRYSTPSWRWPPSSGCRCFSTAAMLTPVSSRSCAPGCPSCRGRAALLHRLRRGAGPVSGAGAAYRGDRLAVRRASRPVAARAGGPHSYRLMIETDAPIWCRGI